MTYLVDSNLKILDTGDQLVIMDVKRGKFYACNQTGAIVVNSLRAGEAMDAIVGELEKRFNTAADLIGADVLRFIQLLVQKKLCRTPDKGA